jgi:hypothetical protein
MAAHAKAVIQKTDQLLLLQMMTAYRPVVAAARHPFVLYAN